jgi:hypothetical protein
MKNIFFVMLYILCACEAKKEEKNITEIQASVDIKSAWEEVPVVDKFGDPVIGKSAIKGDFEGKMSNSATNDAALKVRISIQDSTLYTVFYEYGKKPARLPDGKIFINLKLSNGDVLNLKQYAYNNILADDDNKLLNALLAETNPIKVILDLSEYSKYNISKYNNGVYSYVIDPTGLNTLIKKGTR